MKSFMDSVVFSRAGNAVTLIKRRNGGPPGVGPTPLKGVARVFSDLPIPLPAPDDEAREPLARVCPELPDDSVAASPGRAPGAASETGFLEAGFYKQLLDQLQVAVCFVDPQRRIRYWNGAAERLTGHSSGEVLGRHYDAGWLEHLDPEGCSLCHEDCPMGRSIEEGRPVRERLFLRHKDGRRICVDVRVMPLHDRDGRVKGGVEILSDATTSVVVESAFRQISEAADRDPLTGLANRRYLDRVLGRYLEQLERSGQPLSLIMSDLDHFKQINDTWGHVVGDKATRPVRHRCFKSIAARLTWSHGSGERSSSCSCPAIPWIPRRRSPRGCGKAR